MHSGNRAINLNKENPKLENKLKKNDINSKEFECFDIEIWHRRFIYGCKLFAYTCVPLIAVTLAVTSNTRFFLSTLVCCLISSGGYICSLYLVPTIAACLKTKGLCGRDLNKINCPFLVPESGGLVSASIFLMCVTSTQIVFLYNDSNAISQFHSSLLSICFMTFLGFVDDVLDLKWRYKLIVPLFASLPIVLSHTGNTSLTMPAFLSHSLNVPTTLELGFLFHVYMILMAIFCSNSINIYAGINGLEVGQALVMSVAIMIYNLLVLINTNIKIFPLNWADPIQHFYSLLLSIPFFTTNVALFVYNWNPSLVFVGDTFTYFAGMYFAAVCMIGHFSKAILLFFIPQLLNFILSLPQLFHLVPCPRHRVPLINKKDQLLYPSPNLTLLNATLWIFGSMSEKRLCKVLLFFQAICCFLGLCLNFFFLRISS